MSQFETLTELLSNLGDLQKLPTDIQKAIINNGGGHANHTLLWKTLTPHKTQMTEELTIAMVNSHGSVESLLNEFIDTATKHFGSGWAWIVVNQKGSLEITSTSNQDSPLSIGHTPILGIDLWEHAYYLKYQNRRPEYIEAILNVINWEIVSSLYSSKQPL